MLHWLIGLEGIGTMVVKIVGACDDVRWRDTMRGKADMKEEGRGLVMVALIAHDHKPFFMGSVVLKSIPAFISSVSPYYRLS